MDAPVALPREPDRVPDLDDAFTVGLSTAVWEASYLPHWTTPDRAGARYRRTTRGLDLLIEEDQLDWRPEDAPLRVSNLQTATYSGAVGSARGMHRHRPDGLTVRTETPLGLPFAPSRGRVDVTVSASADPGCMTAVWLVGTEHVSPRDAGEICVVEIDSDARGPVTRVRAGLKAHHDDRLEDDMAEVVVPFDAARPHTWTAVWGDGETRLGCDGVLLRGLPQAPDYPLVLMIDLFEIAGPGGAYPKRATVHRVRGWSG